MCLIAGLSCEPKVHPHSGQITAILFGETMGQPLREYKQTKTTKYHTKDELILAWVDGSISLESILKMFRKINYGQDRRTRKELYRGALHRIYKVKADILFGCAQDHVRIRNKYGQELIDREISRNKRPKKVEESEK